MNVKLMSPCNTRLPGCVLMIGLLLITGMGKTFAAEEGRYDYLLFADLTGIQRFSLPSASDAEQTGWNPALTLLATAERDNFRFFTEAHVGRHVGVVEKELSRLQAGWKPTPGDTVWLGRFHTPVGFWNSLYHHGQYVPTAITRPEIEEDDDEDGILQSHIVGVQVEGEHPAGEVGTASYVVIIGKSAELGEEGLESPRLPGPQHSDKTIIAFSLGYHPDEGAPPLIALALSKSRMPAKGLAIDEVDQTAAALFGTWEHDPLRVIGGLFYLRNKVSGSGTSDRGTFSNAYLQVEYTALFPWTFYGRAEGSAGIGADPYLALFPEFITSQAMAGIRWDFARNQALKLEAAQPRTSAGRFRQVSAQWSMGWP